MNAEERPEGPLTQGGAGSSPTSEAAQPEIDWVNTDEAARRLGITTRTLYRFIDKGELPAYRFGRVFRLKRREVEAFIESCRVEPGTLSHLYPDAGAAEDNDL